MSYADALRAVGAEVYCYGIGDKAKSAVKFGRFGRRALDFVPIEPWLRRINGDVVRAAVPWEPDTVVSFGMSPLLRGGALGQISAATRAVSVSVWPDTLVNVGTPEVARLASFDVVASYSAAAVKVFERWGAKEAFWLPFAADEDLFTRDAEPITDRSGVVFVGGWRPEREQVLADLDSVGLKIWGPGWAGARRRSPALRNAVQKGSLYGDAYFAALRTALVNVNPIDSTNYPASNMRFFEIPAVAGFQAASTCPEWSDEFRHAEHLFYWRTSKELNQIVKAVEADRTLADDVGRRASELVKERHTYRHRAELLLERSSRRRG